MCILDLRESLECLNIIQFIFLFLFFTLSSYRQLQMYINTLFVVSLKQLEIIISAQVAVEVSIFLSPRLIPCVFI